MKVFENYSEYRNEKNNYEQWKASRDNMEARRLAYVNSNSISEEKRKSDIRRAEAVLNSIDIMDEYSQSKAEDMEIVTDQIKGLMVQLGTILSMGIGSILALSKRFKNNINSVFKEKKFANVPKLILPAVLTLIPTLASIVLSSSWGAGKETKASRIGRAEAINKTLYSTKQFAELTDEQEKEVEDIAKGIYIEPKEAKKMNRSSNGFGIISSFKTMFSNNVDEENTLNYLDYKTNLDKQHFDSINLTDKDIAEAKRDKQLIQNVVEKIDIASQEYSENVELATGAVTTVALAGGALTGFLSNKIIKKIPKLAAISTLISSLVGITVPVLFGIFGAKLQKQASRVGRHKVKQDLMQNPDKLIYVDEDETKNIEAPKIKKENKPGLIKFYIQAIKDNKEYNKYLKKEYVEVQKRAKAREKIELTPEQEERAKQLQLNVFKMFNKLDEKSQSFSESTEAIGEMLTNGITTTLSLAGVALSTLYLTKNATKEFNKKTMLIAYAPTVLAVGMALIMNALITKEQKKAAKVANMLAINELDDYRNFINYDNISSRSEAANSPK